jgi:hypothetical protein
MLNDLHGSNVSPECRTETHGAKFCPECGHKLKE